MGFSSSVWKEDLTAFATPEDYAECARLHRMHGTTYYFASRRLPLEIRRRVDAVYGFVRVPDEWVDNPTSPDPIAIGQQLQSYRQEMLAATYGKKPTFPVLRAFADVMREVNLPMSEPMEFLDAMEMDISKSRYTNYTELVKYMRGSAAAVGLMMLHVLGAKKDKQTSTAAISLGEAMQLTNFLRDVREDALRGRIYLPLDEMAEFGVVEQDILESRITPEFRLLLKFQIDRARALFAASDPAIAELPQDVRLAVGLARELYARILDKIEEADYDVFTRRVKTTPQEKMVAAWRLWTDNNL